MGVKGCGNDNIAALLQVFAQKDAAGVNVDGAAHRFLNGMHAVQPVELDLSENTSINIPLCACVQNSQRFFPFLSPDGVRVTCHCHLSVCLDFKFRNNIDLTALTLLELKK